MKEKKNEENERIWTIEAHGVMCSEIAVQRIAIIHLTLSKDGEGGSRGGGGGWGFSGQSNCHLTLSFSSTAIFRMLSVTL